MAADGDNVVLRAAGVGMVGAAGVEMVDVLSVAGDVVEDVAGDVLSVAEDVSTSEMISLLLSFSIFS